MIQCSCGYENKDDAHTCIACRAPLRKPSAEEKKAELEDQWSFTNVGAVRQTAGVNPLKAEGASKGGGMLKKILILLGLIVLLGLIYLALYLFRGGLAL